MPTRALLLWITLARTLDAGVVRAGEGFRTEVSVGFGYAGSKVDEPVVAIDGLQSLDYAYRGDASARSVDVGAVRYFARVEDDGSTPFDLLPYVARVPSLAARIRLTGIGLDSSGVRRDISVVTESGSTGDRTTTDASLSGVVFVRKGLALVGGLSSVTLRETDATFSRETPGGRVTSANLSPRSSTLLASLGVEGRFLDHAISIAGTYRDLSARRTDQLLFASGGSQTISTELTGKAWGAVLKSRLLLSRRLSIDVSGSYEKSSSDVTSTVPVDAPYALERADALGVTLHAHRSLGLTLGASYGTRTDVSGLDDKRRTAAVRTVALSAAVRFWASSRASAALAVSRSLVDSVTSPGQDTFQQLVTTRVTVDLSGTLRF